MKKRIVFLAVLSVSLGVVSCDSGDSPFGPISRSQLNATGLRVTVATSGQGADGLTFRIGIKNDGFREATLNFSCSQMFDIEVTDGRGKLVWRWAYDKAFLQYLWQIELPSAESYAQEANWDLTGNDKKPLPPGSYRARVYITNYPRDEGLGVEFTLII
jgi:hypothetical protein